MMLGRWQNTTYHFSFARLNSTCNLSKQGGQEQVGQQDGHPGHVGVLWEDWKKMMHINFLDKIHKSVVVVHK